MRSKACKPLKEGLDPGPSHTHKDPSLVQTPDLVQTQSSPDLVKTQSSPNLVQRRDTDGTKGQEKSQKELLHLLVIMEGELQARDDVIAVLRSQRWGPDVLEAHYGSSAPLRPLQALQRDTALSRNPDDVYEAPMAELDLLQQQYSDTYRMMVEQLNSEKLKHKEFMRKSDDFTNLLEADRIRLKQLVEQEKWSQIHKDKEHVEHLGKLRSEVLQLRTLLLLLLHQLQNQRRSIRELRRNLQQREKSLSQSLDRGKHQEQVILRLETELEQEATKLFSEREDTTNQLLTQDSQMHLLQLQLTQFCSTTQDLQQKNQDLQQKNQDLQQKNQDLQQKNQDLQQKNQDLQQKNQDLQQRNQNLTQRNQDLEQRNQNLTQKNQELQSSGHMVLTERVSAKGSPSLVQELEILRGKLSEMEEKEENLSRMESQCGELRMKLEEAQSQSSVLRKEVEEVQQRLGQTQKLEKMFLKSEAESSQLRLSLEEEKQSVKDLSAALESVRAKVKELEETEEKLEETERALREDLSKLRSLTLTMAEEHKEVREELGRERERSEEMEERLRSERERREEMEERLRSERERSEEMEERLRSERERREEMEEKLRSERKRSEEMEERLRQEQENVSEVTEKMEEESKRWMKVKSELEQSAEEERRKLKSSFQLEGHVARSKISLRGKGQMWEEPSPEMRTLKSREKVSQLDSRCKEAESELQTLFRAEKKKNEELRAETLTLKEQIHQLRTTEDHRLCQLQMELQEVKRRQQTEEVPHMDNLRRFSRVSGQRLVPVSSSSSQTENFDDDSTDGFIRRCVQEENSFMTSLQQQGHTSLRQQGHKPVLERYPLARTLPPPLQTHQPHAPLRIRFSPSLSSCSTLEFTGVSDRLRACPTRVCMVPQSSSSSHRLSSSTSSTSSSSTSSSAVTIAAVSKAQKGQRNVIRVEDSTIHIRLGAPLTQRSEEVTEKSSTKKSSSIMITPTNGNARKGGFGPGSSPGPCPGPGPVWSKPVQSLSALGLCSITRVHESKAEHLKIQMKTSNL